MFVSAYFITEFTLYQLVFLVVDYITSDMTRDGIRIFSRNGRRGRVGRSLYLRVADSMGFAHKILQFENWNLIENYCTRNTSNASVEISMRVLSRVFAFFIILCLTNICLFQKGGSQPPNPSPPPHPAPPPPAPLNLPLMALVSWTPAFLSHICPQMKTHRAPS